MTMTKYELAADIVSRVNQDGSVVIMKMDDSNNFFKINGVAAEIWTGLSNAKNVEDILSDILENYEVTPHLLKKDSDALINTLLEKNLILKKIS